MISEFVMRNLMIWLIADVIKYCLILVDALALFCISFEILDKSIYCLDPHLNNWSLLLSLCVGFPPLKGNRSWAKNEHTARKNNNEDDQCKNLCW